MEPRVKPSKRWCSGRGSGSGFTDPVAPGDYISNNKTSGITFLIFNRVTNIKGVNLNVGPSNDSGSSQDFGDSIYIETGDHSTGNPLTPVNFINSKIITGNEMSPVNDNDLVVFGSDQAKDGQTYLINQGTFKATINGLLASSSDTANQSPLILQSSTVQTGNGNDTLIFANTNTATKLVVLHWKAIFSISARVQTSSTLQLPARFTATTSIILVQQKEPSMAKQTV